MKYVRTSDYLHREAFHYSSVCSVNIAQSDADSYYPHVLPGLLRIDD